MAKDYDWMFKFFSKATAEIIKELIPLNRDDQIIDVGGGTAQVSLMVKEDLCMIKPVVCIDPSKEMLSVAEKNGAITIQATAEDFFASKPDFPLKVVFMTGCVHHFERPEFVFSKLASYMPEDGVCIVTMNTLPLFKGSQNIKSTKRLEEVSHKIDFESQGLKCRLEKFVRTGKVDKELWYKSIRTRLSSFLSRYTDEELEEGINELEKEYKDQTVVKLETTISVLIVSKK